MKKTVSKLLYCVRLMYSWPNELRGQQLLRELLKIDRTGIKQKFLTIFESEMSSVLIELLKNHY